jgi:DNA polymerase (family 10)
MAESRVDKKTVVSTLQEIAVLLELAGANPFKARAFDTGARAVQSYGGDLMDGLRSGELAQIKGIGKSLLAEVEALLSTGTSPAREELRAQVPAGLLELIQVSGLGPKRARQLHERLGIASIGELEYACNENRIAQLPGYGVKTQENFLKGIATLRRFAGRHLLSSAWQIADALTARVAALPGVSRCELAGSIRRRRETIRDIDILVSTADPQRVSDAFVAFEEVERVLGHGPTKSSVLTRDGIQVDLRVVEEAQFPFALHYFTGSKEHNTAMRARARARGLKLNEYGLFPADGPEGAAGAASPGSVRCASEAELFAALELAEIAPELREDMGEIEAAQQGQLPSLLQQGDLRGALHNHSAWSDGADSIEAMALAARALGWEYFGLSDHSQSAFYAHGLKPDDVERQHEEIDALNARLPGITILKGIESDILPDGRLDYDDETLARFDFVVASVHGQFGLSESEQTKRCVRAVQNPFTTVLGHPTGRLLLAREGFAINLRAVLEAAADSGCAVELNANPHRLDLDWRELKAARELGALISIGPDAHRQDGLADLRYGVAIARKGWLTARDVLNTRPLAQLRGHLAARRAAA